MDARTTASVFVAITLFCASLEAQQVELQPLAPAHAAGTPAYFAPGCDGGLVADCACGNCDTSCDCDPWRLFCQRECGWNFYGWANAGIFGNTSSPASKFNGPYNAVDRSNELMLNQLYFIGEKKLPGDGCFGIGGRVDVIYGEDHFLAQSVGLENHDDGTPHWNSEYYGWAIPQAYLEFGRSDLSLKVGHFYSIIGYEGLPASTSAGAPRSSGNFFYSKSYSYQFAGPFTHWGALATWSPNSCWDIQFGLTNGWDTLDREPRDSLNVLAKAKYTGDSGWWTSFGIVTGDDISNPSGQAGIANAITNRTRYSWLVSLPVTCNTEYVFHQWLGSQEAGAIGGGTAYWYGIDQYLYYTINDCWRAGLRFEWFRDEDGTRVGLNRPSNPNNPPFVGNFYSLSAGLNWMPTANLTVRPELRFDWFDGAQAVQPYDDGASSSQVLLGIDAILLF